MAQNRKRRTFDNRGRLLGDDALPPDLQNIANQAAVDTGQASAGTPGNPLMLDTMTVTAPALPGGLSFAQLLQPPYVYFLVGAIAFAAYVYSSRRDA
jgi:hypothetical protein